MKLKRMMKRFASIPVMMTIMLMGGVYYVTVFVVIKDWLDLNSSAGSINAFFFTFLGKFCLFSLFASVNTHPGPTPSHYVPDLELISKHTTTKCDKCRNYKPPRAHHCRICKNCILRMDHHCKWINNCVGHRNYKSFLILVLNATIGSLYSLVMIILCALQMNWDYTQWTHLNTFYIICGFFMSALSLMFGTLLGWHIYLISNNMTTIEYYESIRASWVARKSGQSYHHPFNVGVYRNMTLILGPNMLKWFWPTAISHLKDGTSFPTSLKA